MTSRRMFESESIRVGVLVLALLSAGIGIAGCHHKGAQSSNPAVVKAVTLLDAENTVNAVSHGLAEANETLKNMRGSEPEYYDSIHPRLAGLAFLNEKANQDILAFKRGDGAVNWRASVQAIARSAGDVQSLSQFGFHNPKSQQVAQLGLAALTSAMRLASQF